MQKIWMQLLKLNLICLTALLLNSCAGFPQITPYVISVKDGKCGQFKPVGKNTACSTNFEFVKWLPLDQCDKFTAISPEDVAALRKYQAQQCTPQN